MPRIQAKSAHNEDFFSNEQLIHFGKELRSAGSFDALMIEKQAARYNEKNQFIVLRYSDIDSYIAQHIVGRTVENAHPFLLFAMIEETDK